MWRSVNVFNKIRQYKLNYMIYTQDICISAIKEKDIESKLKQVKADWAVQNLKFNTFKARGEMLLKGEDTSATISMMEDSLMVLGSLMSNRYLSVQGM